MDPQKPKTTLPPPYTLPYPPGAGPQPPGVWHLDWGLATPPPGGMGAGLASDQAFLMQLLEVELN